jgi:transposase
VRTVQRAVEERRRSQRAAQVATVRFETAPGEQMQVDVGQRLVSIAGQQVRVFFVCAVLGYSRRLFVRAFLSTRQAQFARRSAPDARVCALGCQTE